MTEHINYGIDLGTTNSCVTRFDGEEVTVIQNSDQMNVTPSVVRVLRSGSIMVGRRAYVAIVEDPDNVAAEFKRLMGQKYHKTFPAAGRSMTPEELSAEVLKSLLGDARRRSASGEIHAAVITVPAAFTALQCEATARAARLAGLEEFPLLQEPIAAAIAYGVKPEARDQRWLVFDLGGGTLDIAVVSTREGRLHVLEHRGDNHLGSKDVDRLLVQNIFLPFLARQFALPDASAERQAHERLSRKLAIIAEYAKIDLSTLPETIVSLVDLGDDREGRPIEAELTLSRSQLEHEVEPLLARCLQLADDALTGARIKGSGLDRILLVGGPTQMPYLRTRVAEHLGTKVDYSLDPMTVVARGAAIYASTIEQAHSHAVTSSAANSAAATPGKLSVRLAFDGVSASVQTAVAGKVMQDTARAAHEVKIEAENGYWTSGWHQLKDGYFEIPVTLQEGRLNRLRLVLRDAAGRDLLVEPDQLSIRHGLVINAPPLPHTISVEVAGADGTIELSPVFPRATLLPAERTVSYRAASTLRPSDYNTSLTIKLWEGEALTDTQANTWVGNMHIHNDRIRRPIPEGAEIQLHIKIDASRLITVEVFVPHLNEHFSDRIYIPQDEEPDYLELLKAVPLEMESYLARLSTVEEQLFAKGLKADEESDDFPEIIYEEGDAPPDEHQATIELDPLADVERLRREIEDLDIEISQHTNMGRTPDHDLAKGLVERAREIRMRLANLEREAAVGPKHTPLEETAQLAEQVERYVGSYGSSTQKEKFAVLQKELQRSSAREDNRGIQKARRALTDLRTQILYSQDWFWQEWFEYFQRPGRQFVNQTEAGRWLAHGVEAQQNQDRKKLEEAVRRLWELEPYDEQTAGKERAVRPGLKL